MGQAQLDSIWKNRPPSSKYSNASSGVWETEQPKRSAGIGLRADKPGIPQFDRDLRTSIQEIAANHAPAYERARRSPVRCVIYESIRVGTNFASSCGAPQLVGGACQWKPSIDGISPFLSNGDSTGRFL